LTVNPDAQQSVEVEYAGDYSGQLSVQVSDSVLQVNQSGIVAPTGSALVRVTVPSITSLESAAGSLVKGSGQVTAYQASASAGARLELADLQAQTVSITLNAGSSAEIYASESVTGRADAGSRLVIYGSPANRSVDAAAGSSVETK